MRLSLAPRRLAAYVALGVLAFCWLLPLLIVLNGALQAHEDSFSLWPHSLTVSNFADVWHETHLSRLLTNSLLVAASSTVIVVIVASMAGFGLALYRFRGSGIVLLLLLSGLMLAPAAVIVPLYRLVVQYHLINNYFALIGPLSAFGMSVGILLFRNGFLAIPGELIEAARIDGASPLRIFARVALPLVKPVTVTVAILQFLAAWNDYILALVFMTDDEKKTAQLAFVTYSAQYLQSREKEFAVMTLVMLPVLVVFVVGQRWFIRGLTSGALK
jgi:alpha-1,4-digalacturonate transport system permease protein